MADVPKNLLQQIERLEELFVVPKEKLISISDHFVKELEKGIIVALMYEIRRLTEPPGLSNEGGTIVSRRNLLQLSADRLTLLSL